MLQRFLTALGKLGCYFGLHAWEPGPGNTRICSRPDCKRAIADLESGKAHLFDREEVTMEQVQKMNRHERRRLGSLARRGAFGKVPE